MAIAIILQPVEEEAAQFMDRFKCRKQIQGYDVNASDTIMNFLRTLHVRHTFLSYLPYVFLRCHLPILQQSLDLLFDWTNYTYVTDTDAYYNIFSKLN